MHLQIRTELARESALNTLSLEDVERECDSVSTLRVFTPLNRVWWKMDERHACPRPQANISMFDFKLKAHRDQQPKAAGVGKTVCLHQGSPRLPIKGNIWPLFPSIIKALPFKCNNYSIC